MDGSQTPALTIEELGPDSRSAWDGFVDGAEDASFFHRAGWKEVIETAFGHRCYFMMARIDGAVVGILPLVHVKSALFGNSLVSTGFTVGGGPVVKTPTALRALEEKALSLADTLDVDLIEYRVREPLHDKGWASKPGLYVGFRRAITSDDDENLKAIPRKQRAMVRKGIKNGLESRIDTTADTLHPIYAESVRNLGTPVFPKRFFAELLRVFGDEIDVVTITKDGTAIASVMNFYFRDQALPYFGGGRFLARGMAANDFMYWEVMRRAAARGFRVFDFGRSKLNTGACSFKKNWGFEPEPWTYEYYLRNVDSVPDINPLNPKYRLFIEGWKRLPLPVANFLGPHITRGLG